SCGRHSHRRAAFVCARSSLAFSPPTSTKAAAKPGALPRNESARPMIANPEAEQFFLSHSAHVEVGSAVIESLKPLGEYELRGELRGHKSPYAVTANIVFCGAAGMSDTFWRLRPADHQ